MKVLNRLVSSNLKKNKKRSLASIVSITMTCVLIFSVSIVFSTIEHRNVEEASEIYGTYHVRFRNLEYLKTYDYFANDKDIAEIVTLQELNTFFYENSLNPFTVSFKSFVGDLSKYVNLIKGNYPKNEKELIISYETSTELTLDIGDSFENYIVSGVYDKTVLNNGIDTYGTLPSFVKDAYTKKPIDENSKSSVFYITYKHIRDAHKKIAENSTDLGLEFYTETRNESKHVKPNRELLEAYNVYDDSGSSLKTVFYLEIILYILSMFCILIIKNSFSLTLDERKRQFGILRSIGASKKQVIALVVKEVLTLSLISIPLAVVLSFAVIHLGLAVINRLLETSISVHVYPNHLLIGCLFILFIIFTSAITPGIKASKTTPMEAIKLSNKVKIKKTKEKYSFIRKIFGVEGELAYKNIKRDGRKFTSTTTTLSISIVLFLLGSTFINFMIPKTDEYEQNFDVRITLHDNEPESNMSIANEIGSLASAKDTLIKSSTYENFTSEKESNRWLNFKGEYDYLNIVGIDDVSLNNYKKKIGVKKDIPIVYNKFTRRGNGNEIYEGSIFEELPEILVCEKRETGNKTCDYTFENVFLTDENYLDEFRGPAIIMSLKDYYNFIDDYTPYQNRIYNADGMEIPYTKYLKSYMEISLNAKNYRKLDIEVREILNKYPNVKIDYSNYALDNHKTHMQQFTVKLILYSALLFIALISLTEMLCSLNMFIRLREREFSMLRSIGMNKLALNKMLRLENVFLVTRSLTSGIFLSVLIILPIMFITNLETDPHYTTPKMHFPWLYIFITIIIVICIIIISTKFIARQVKKQNIIESIRKDSI